jgi:hypothetical protein
MLSSSCASFFNVLVDVDGISWYIHIQRFHDVSCGSCDLGWSFVTIEVPKHWHRAGDQ